MWRRMVAGCCMPRPWPRGWRGMGAVIGRLIVALAAVCTTIVVGLLVLVVVLLVRGSQ